MQMYGTYPIGNGQFNIVMELVDGDWRDAWKVQTNDARLYDLKTRLFISAADAYTALHAADMVHYDIKVDNLFYLGRHALVGDYGLARSLRDRATIPGSSVPKGTYIPDDLKYQTPQPMKGDPFKVDIFAFAFAMLEMRLGRSLYEAMKQEKCCMYYTSDKSMVTISGTEFLKAFDTEIKAAIPNQYERKLIKAMLIWDHKAIPTNPTMAKVAAQLRAIYSINDM